MIETNKFLRSAREKINAIIHNSMSENSAKAHKKMLGKAALISVLAYCQSIMCEKGLLVNDKSTENHHSAGLWPTETFYLPSANCWLLWPTTLLFLLSLLALIKNSR